MKKIAMILIASTIVLASCGGATNTPTSATDSTKVKVDSTKIVDTTKVSTVVTSSVTTTTVTPTK